MLDPEVQTTIPKTKLELTWKDHLTVLGVIRFVFGYVRDSTNRPNNMLALLYASLVVFSLVMVRVSAPCTPAQVASSSPPSVTRAGGLDKTARASIVSWWRSAPGVCTPPLPPAFFYALVAPIVLFLGGYLLRHPELRAFVERLAEAKWGKGREKKEGGGEVLASSIAGAWGDASKGEGGASSPVSSVPPPPPPPPPLVSRE